MGKFVFTVIFIDKVTDIVIHNNQSNITNNSKIKIRKDCSIKIYSGCIGIDEPDSISENELLESKFNLNCPQGNGVRYFPDRDSSR